jgi:hypothetical protein
MYSVEADGSKRLVVISAAGHVSKEEVKTAAQEVREIVKDAAPGFRVLSDFRWLESMEPAAARHIAEIMDALVEKEVGKVVRVVPDPHKDIGLNILSPFHYGSKVQVVTFESLAEALEALTEDVKSQKAAVRDKEVRGK